MIVRLNLGLFIIYGGWYRFCMYALSAGIVSCQLETVNTSWGFPADSIIDIFSWMTAGWRYFLYSVHIQKQQWQEIWIPMLVLGRHICQPCRHFHKSTPDFIVNIWCLGFKFSSFLWNQKSEFYIPFSQFINDSKLYQIQCVLTLI